MRYRIVVVCALILAGLSGCDFTTGLQGLMENTGKVEETIKAEHGLDVSVGANMHNGRLTNVNVSFQAEQVRDMKVSKLETIARDAVKAGFDSSPRVLNVVITAAEPAESEQAESEQQTPAPANEVEEQQTPSADTDGEGGSS